MANKLGAPVGGSQLVRVIGSGGVESVSEETGETTVDNTDPANPIVGLPDVGPGAGIYGDGNETEGLYINSVSLDDEGRVTAISSLPLPQTNFTQQQEAIRIAVSRIGNLGIDGQQLFFDCDNTGGWTFSAGGSGILTVDTNNGGGYWNLVTGTTTGSFAGANLTNTAQVLTRAASNRLWHLVVRMAVTSTPAAGTEMRAGTFANFVGHLGSASATNYIGRVGGTTLVSTRAINTSQRIIELWSDGFNIFLSVDNETPVSGAATTPGSAYPFVQAFNGATTTNVTGTVDWMNFYSVRDI